MVSYVSGRSKHPDCAPAMLRARAKTQTLQHCRPCWEHAPEPGPSRAQHGPHFMGYPRSPQESLSLGRRRRPMAARSADCCRRRREAPSRPKARKALSAEGAIGEAARHVRSTRRQKRAMKHGQDKLGSTATTRRVQESFKTHCIYNGSNTCGH